MFLQRSLKLKLVSPIDAKLADRVVLRINNLEGNGKSGLWSVLAEIVEEMR
jgi:hypothetical protein